MITQEIEKKIILTEIQYKILLYHFTDKKAKTIAQINYYYDATNYDLLNKGETLRVRQINNQLVLQIKYNKNIQDGIIISKELCKGINCLPKIISINGLITHYIGFLLTERIIIKCDAYIIFFDKNFYMGKVDYEMEIEAANILDIPNEICGIELAVNCSGKYTRFIDELIKKRDCHEISR